MAVEVGLTNIGELITTTDLSTATTPTPVPTNDDKPLGSQIANNVIELNPKATINDFNIPDGDVVVLTKPVDGATDADYTYGTYRALLLGAGKYVGSTTITGKFGRLIPKGK